MLENVQFSQKPRSVCRTAGQGAPVAGDADQLDRAQGYRIHSGHLCMCEFMRGAWDDYPAKYCHCQPWWQAVECE